jgi:hypothetical protein
MHSQSRAEFLSYDENSMNNKQAPTSQKNLKSEEVWFLALLSPSLPLSLCSHRFAAHAVSFDILNSDFPPFVQNRSHHFAVPALPAPASLLCCYVSLRGCCRCCYVSLRGSAVVLRWNHVFRLVQNIGM